MHGTMNIKFFASCTSDSPKNNQNHFLFLCRQNTTSRLQIMWINYTPYKTEICFGAVFYCCEHLDLKIKVFSYVTLRRNIPKHLNLQHHLCENPKLLEEDYYLPCF